MKKRNMVIYVEFFHNQNPADMEDMLRQASKTGGFPPFSRIMVGIDHRGLRSIKTAVKRGKDLPYILHKNP